MNILNNCRLCPRKCGADRENGKRGYCSADKTVKIARSALHMWEEPCISGTNGSGTVFFSHCALKCVFCQNYKISHGGSGYEISEKELAEEFLKLQGMGAHNINLVTPTHYVPQIIRTLDIAKSAGLTVPIVYNTGGYEMEETIDMLNGYVDVYMPDIKYYSDKHAVKYSAAPNYFKTAAKAVSKMFNQVGENKFDENGIMRRGVLIRHMLLPGLLNDSKKVIDYIYSTYGDSVYISIMSQYIPSGDLTQYPELNRRINPRAYNALIDYCARKGIQNAFVQDLSSASETFVPDFYTE